MNVRITIITATILLALASALQVVAQVTFDGRPPVYDSRTKTYLLTVPEHAFDNGPVQMRIAIDDGVTDVKIAGQVVGEVVEFPQITCGSSYSFVFKRNKVTTRSSIRFTYLPILVLTGTFGNDYVQAPVKVIEPDSNLVMNYQAQVKWAGSSTNGRWTNKRNFHLKFVDEQGEKTDVSFFGLRDDNHWRLDAGTVDMIRFRNKAAHDLWADFGNKPYYGNVQPKTRSYVRGGHVEIFINNAYHGFYNLTECLDRKQMKLKKYDVVDDDQQSSFLIHGLLWKAKEDTPETLFNTPSTMVDNTLGEWAGYELEYPDIDEVCPTDYSVLHDAIIFVVKSNNQTFAAQVGDRFDLPVLVDYYVFINALYAIDNVCKNIIWGCYDSQVDNKLTLAVWDLDATVGQHWRDHDGYYHAEGIQPEHELTELPDSTCQLMHNRLFMRLRAMPQFRMWTINRYWQLREDVLDPDNLVNHYAEIYDRLYRCGALDRETVRWSGIDDINYRPLVFDEEFDYLCNWLRRRVAYMDANTFACLRGDVNGDGRLNVSDVSELINSLINGKTITNMAEADVTADNAINVSDVVELINLIMNH